MTLLVLLLLAQDGWTKRTPIEGSPTSPRLGYEGDCVWHAKAGRILRYGGHNQGGGGEQHSEIWTCDPATWTWTLHEPNVQPPGVCCAQQNVYDPLRALYVRFPSFSGSHGWQWRREIELNQSSVWTYDLAANRWRDRRPLPAPALAPLRCAAWDGDHDVVVVFGGEGSREGTLVYDPYVNAWTRMRPSKEPPFRSGGNMAYDAARKVHVLFGTQFSNDPATWTYDLRADAWRDLRPATSPPTDKNDAVLAYDAAGKRVLAVVKVGDGLQTWSFDGAAWSRPEGIREPDPSGNRARVLMAAPERGEILLENCTSTPREQQVWSWRTGTIGTPKIASLRVTTAAASASLSWDPPIEATVRRAAAAVPWKAEYADIGKGAGAFVDNDVKPGTLYFYEVEGVRGRAQPAVPEDVVVSVLARDRIDVTWSAVPDAVRYVVERAPVEVLSDEQLKALKSRTPPIGAVGAVSKVGAFARFEASSTSWSDSSADLSGPKAGDGEPVWQKSFSKEAVDGAGAPYARAVYAYRVRAVNALGVEGGASAAVLTIPSPVQHVFAKEDGTTARLKWAANPEKGIAGYRVYRMDGRFDKEPITRLTADPIAEREFSDPSAGKKSRRYHVVAVDALGQEGQPSSPVWHEREWKPYYARFTGEWHQ